MVQLVGGFLAVLPEDLGPLPVLVGGMTVGISEVGATAMAVGRLMTPNGRRGDRRPPEREIAGVNALFLDIDESEHTRWLGGDELGL